MQVDMRGAANMDDQVSVGELKEHVRRFCEERDWDQFHGSKDLAIGIVTEASELLEHFRFLSDDQIQRLLSTPLKRKAVEEELADILFFVLRFSQRFNIDLDQSLQKKLKMNALKYPIKKARGRNLKYTDL
jgi:NTP pyrophosphatase (non-canonical NTP hydrolase)